MRWAWATALGLLWPQLALLGAVGARRPGPRAESRNATVANSEGLPGAPKVRADGARGARTGARTAHGAWARAHLRHRSRGGFA